jgi:predicted transcriptional regulator
MVQQDLIRVVQNRKRKIYIITEKGMDTLKYIEKARALVAFKEAANT